MSSRAASGCSHCSTWPTTSSTRTRRGHHEVALAAAEAALALEPDNQELVNDRGWTLYERGQPDRALPFLQRAVEMDPQDELAAENLRICRGACDDPT